MKRHISLCLIALLTVCVGLLAQTRPNFSGTWKIEFDPKTSADTSQATQLTISQNVTAFTVDMTFGSSVDHFVFKLDGTDSPNNTRPINRPVVSHAAWVGNALVISSSVEDLHQGTIRMKQSFSLVGDKLVVEVSATAQDGSAAMPPTKVAYKKT
jgi:hypothetical protein